MAAIPDVLRRGDRVRRDLSYVRYARACWQWWCREHDIELIVLERPVAGALSSAPAPVQRWQAVRDRFRGQAIDQIAVVDADTMVRWDTPDFFELAGESLAAVHVGTQRWLERSLATYQRFFPFALGWTRCFNSGLVVLNHRHLDMLSAFVDFYAGHQAELATLQSGGDVGVDQTLLNYFVAAHGLAVHLLPPAFNLMGVCKLSSDLWLKYEEGQERASTGQELSDYFASRPELFGFIDAAYVWHFTNTVATRAVAMAETWRRVQSRYPRAALPE